MLVALCCQTWMFNIHISGARRAERKNALAYSHPKKFPNIEDDIASQQINKIFKKKVFVFVLFRLKKS